MASSYYTVEIAGISKAAPSDGFIDPTTIEAYMAKPTPTVPTTLAASTTKERANIRYNYVVQQLQFSTNIYVTSVDTPGADANTAPTSITLHLEVEQGDSVLTTPDETTPGEVLTGTDALTRWVARALLHSDASNFGEIYDPTLTSDINFPNAGSTVRFGNRVIPTQVGALAADLTTATTAITTTKIG